MGNVSLQVLEKSLNFLFKNGYEPCTLLTRISSTNFDIREIKIHVYGIRQTANVS